MTEQPELTGKVVRLNVGGAEVEAEADDRVELEAGAGAQQHAAPAQIDGLGV